MTIVDRRYSVSEGTAVKAPCRVGTTANIALTGLQAIDGVTVVADDRVLVKNQTTGSENGIYTASTGNWSRARDFDGAYDIVTGTRVWVTSGNANANTDFVVTTTGSIVIGSSSIAFDTFENLTETPPAGVLYNWDDGNTDADPGAGKIRASNDTLSSATTLYLSKTDRNGDSVATWLASLDDALNGVKGQIVLTRSRTGSQVVFNLTVLTDATNYVKLSVSNHSGAAGFSLGDPISFQFSRSGDSSDPISVATRTALKALDPAANKTAFLSESGREGTFIWKSGNYASLVTADANGGIYLKADNTATSSGAWERVHNRGIHDVKWFGAAGDNSTNDYAAIQACIDFTESIAGGTVLFTKGGYVCNTGLVVDTALVRLEGVGTRFCSLRSAVASINLITVSAARCSVTNLSIFNQVLGGAQSALITVASGAVQCVFSDLDMVGGWNAFLFKTGSANNTARDVVARATNGGQIVDIQGGQFVTLHDCVFDHDWPVATPASANFKGARADSTAYAIGDVVTVSGVYLQARVAGTTGVGAPSLLFYENDITDGSVIWRLANTVGSCAVRCDTGAIRIRIVDCDHTGAFDQGIVISDSLAGADPYEIMIDRCESSGIVSNAVAISSGNRISITNCEFNQPVGTASTKSGVILLSGVSGDVLVQGCRMASGFNIGVYIGAGTGVQVAGNRLFTTTGVHVSANVTRFIVAENSMTSATWGTASTGILIEAGTSDFYKVVNNLCAGVATKVSDGGTGLNKTLTGND